MVRVLLALCLLAGSPPAAALRVQLSAQSVEHPALAQPLRDLRFGCRLTAAGGAMRCEDGQLRLHLRDQPLALDFDAQLQANGDWRVDGRGRARALNAASADGRHAADRLDLDLSGRVARRGSRLDAELRAALPRGQAYVEPVFVDFGAMPATLAAHLRLDLRTRALEVSQFELTQAGVLRANGTLGWTPPAPPELHAEFADLQLGPAFATWAQPFLAGTRWEKARLGGQARGQVEWRGRAPQRLALVLQDTGIAALDAELRGIDGPLNWQAQGADAPASALRWRGGRIGRLELGAGELALRGVARDLQLLAPLRLPLAGGALVVRAFELRKAGAADMSARFDAGVEPIDLAALCRAFGWPEFGGTLGGQLPGLTLADRELRLDGALSARAFDGRIAVENLRVLDPFGRVPRVQADVRLRDLDLAAVTGAFSFGRIEGRLDGDVEGLRLLDWKPVAFRARLGTPPPSNARQRISQRAIDNISSIGGGPRGVLSRGALRFFDDFAYARIGWSCVLSGGVCRMGGVAPTRDGGYVLVQGRWLPRIDVVGYARDVDWNTFIEQLRSARAGRGVELR